MPLCRYYGGGSGTSALRSCTVISHAGTSAVYTPASVSGADETALLRRTPARACLVTACLHLSPLSFLSELESSEVSRKPPKSEGGCSAAALRLLQLDAGGKSQDARYRRQTGTGTAQGLQGSGISAACIPLSYRDRHFIHSMVGVGWTHSHTLLTSPPHSIIHFRSRLSPWTLPLGGYP